MRAVEPEQALKATGRSRIWWLFIAATIAALVGLVIWVVNLVGTPRGQRAKAWQAVGARRFDDARIVLREWLKADPESGEARYLLARTELATGHPQEAMNALGKAMDYGYPADKLAPYRAVILAGAGGVDEAEPILRKALLDAPDEPQPEIAKALARIYLDSFRLREAASPLARWMRDDPNDPLPYLWQNEIETRSDADHAVSIQNYREALKRDPKLWKAVLGLADRLRMAHRLEEAAEEFAKYIQANPNDPEGHLGAGRVALELGKSADAANAFDRVLELDPNDSIALKERGAIALKMRKFKESKGFLERAIKVDLYDPDSHYNLSLILQGLGDEAGAKRELEISQKLRGEHSRLSDLKSAMVKKPKDLTLRVEVSQWMLEHGREAEGLQWSQQVFHDAPGYEPMVRVLIDYFTKKKDAGKANYYRMMLK